MQGKYNKHEVLVFPEQYCRSLTFWYFLFNRLYGAVLMLDPQLLFSILVGLLQDTQVVCLSRKVLMPTVFVEDMMCAHMDYQAVLLRVQPCVCQAWPSRLGRIFQCVEAWALVIWLHGNQLLWWRNFLLVFLCISIHRSRYICVYILVIKKIFKPVKVERRL